MIEIIIFISTIILIFVALIYYYSAVKKCTIYTATKDIKRTFIIIFKAFFSKDQVDNINLRIGSNENGFFVRQLIVEYFKELGNLFDIFKLKCMPLEYENFNLYQFIAKGLKNINDELIAVDFIKSIVEGIVTDIFIDFEIKNVDVKGFVDVVFDMEKGNLYIFIAQNQAGIQAVSKYAIILENKIHNEKKSNDKIMKEEWHNVN